MLGVYIFCAIVGIPLVLMMAFLGGDTDLDFDADLDLDLDLDMDVDLDMDMDVDVDVDPDLETGLDIASAGGVAGDAFTSMLSIRAAIFALAGFGTGGLVGYWSGLPLVVHVVMAIVAGLGFAFASSFALAWVKQNETNSEVRKIDLQGKAARVTVPVAHHQRGKVTLLVQGKPTQMTAKLFSEKGDQQLSVGDQVVVVEVDESGTALIARLDSLANE